MYFFITQLSLCDIMLSTIIIPNLLEIVLHEGCIMSLVRCIIQFCFFGSTEISECYLLTIMSYDRYLAICKPLHYNAIMSPIFCRKSVIFLWFFGFSMILFDTVPMCALDFCGPNVIDHFYCDFDPILALSCSDTSWLHTQSLAFAFFCIIVPFLTICISYVYIVSTILKIPTAEGRHKPFTTCSSHLTVVSIFFGTLFIVYMFPKKEQTPNQGKILSMFYTVMTPLLNPIIYTFRNRDFKKALKVVTSVLRTLL
ncbi:olfactory receptor 10A7-like [Gastrophryne carolinensis]